MPRGLYDKIPVRDGLAGERTVLAAERTFLAYVRTAFAMFVTGLTGAQFLKEPTLIMVAHALTALSVVVFVIGVRRFAKSRVETRRMLERLTEDE